MIPTELVEWGASGSLIREIAEYGARCAAAVGEENVFNFSIGSPSIAPPPVVGETMLRLLQTVPHERLHAYAPAPGMPEVRERLAGYLKDSFDVPYRAEDVLMTNGSSTALALILRVLLARGGRVLTPVPFFPEYRFYAESAGGALTGVPSEPDTMQPDLCALERALEGDVQAVILNSPNNPSGAVIRRDRLNALASLLESRQEQYGHPIYLIADEPYRELVYDGIEVPFLPAIYRNTVYCYSFSKSLSLPGERIGFLALTPGMDEHDALHDAVLGVLRAYGYLCLPPLFQLTAAECIGRTSDLSIYRRNRDLIYGALCEMGYSCIHPDGAFYLFFRAPGGDAQAFCRRAMQEDLLLVPGDGFGCPDHVRLAYCTAPEKLRRSLPVFRRLAEEYHLG